MALIEQTYISQFDVRKDGQILVRKTTEVLRDDVVIATTYWRCVLRPNDPNAQAVLGAEPFFLDQAQHAWANLPESGNA
jgi:hypothetical protein